jgi:hypothetical protein
MSRFLIKGLATFFDARWCKSRSFAIQRLYEEYSMRLLGCLLICLAGLSPLAMAGADSDPAEMFERMKTGGHILMLRHAFAPGTGDPANFQIGDCSTKRNLEDRGREQAAASGHLMRSKGIA